MDKHIPKPKKRTKKTTVIIITTLSVFLFLALGMYFFYEPSKKRSQEPTKPYSYYSEDVTFQNVQANITLAGTLTLPAKEGNYPAVILITGSGPQNRDEEMLGHKPFLVISDHLTKNGLAVLRYDDRGFGQSTGDFKSGNSRDFATDVESAISYLKTRREINKNKIGLLGHSDGAMIAPMVAAKSQDVSFIVLLAGPGIQGRKLAIARQELMTRGMVLSEEEKKSYKKMLEILSESNNPQTLKADLTQFAKENLESIPAPPLPPGMTKEKFVAAQIDEFTSPWYTFFLNYDPVPNLAKVTCPVLALNGDKDVQVPSQLNLTEIGLALKKGGNKNVTIKELPNLNHLFQECKTGSLSEYATIEQTFSPIALSEISAWILNQCINIEQR